IVALCAAGCLLQYAKETQRTALPHINTISLSQERDFIVIDVASRRNLELTQNLAGGTENTLASVLDYCSTPMGSRLLIRWIHQPLHHKQTILNRQNAVKNLTQQQRYSDFKPLLQQIGDMERILARIALRSARPRDLTRLRQ